MFYVSGWTSNLNLFDGTSLSNWQSDTDDDQNSSITDPDLIRTDSGNENSA